MMRSHVELVTPPPMTTIQPRPRAGMGSLAVAGVALLALALAGSYAANRQLDRFLADLDVKALHGSEQAFAHFIEQERRHMLSQVGVLVDDTRIRSTVIGAKLDEATIRDVLSDLKGSSGASALAILDVRGKVRVVVGADRLNEVEIGSSRVVNEAARGPASDVWTFPDQLLVVGLAPIRAGGQVQALLMMGFALGEPVLSAVQRTTGVHGAIFVGEKMLAASSRDLGLQQAWRQAGAMQDGADQIVGGEGEYLGRAVRASDSSTSAKAIWLLPMQHHERRIGFLRIIVWVPALAVAMTLLLMAVLRPRAA